MKKILLVVCVVMVAVLLATMFVACSAEDYAKKLEKKDYKVVSATSDNTAAMIAARSAAKVLIGNVEANLEFIVFGAKEGSMVAYIKFEESSDAKKLVDALKENDDLKVSRSSGLVTVKTKD